MNKNLPYNRAERLAEVLFEVVSKTVYNELADPRLHGVQITRVRVTRDMRLARVNYHIENADEKKRDEVFKAFVKSKGYLKRSIASEIDLRFMPELEFFYDETADVETKIEELFKNIAAKEARDE